ncbi:MAG: hypothetical protein FWD00_00575 [Clostridiales bacterium]|nr:hypothetical protein [Clostridiales bacterium]
MMNQKRMWLFAAIMTLVVTLGSIAYIYSLAYTLTNDMGLMFFIFLVGAVVIRYFLKRYFDAPSR